MVIGNSYGKLIGSLMKKSLVVSFQGNHQRQTNIGSRSELHISRLFQPMRRQQLFVLQNLHRRP